MRCARGAPKASFSATRSISVASAGARVPSMSTISGKRRNTAFDGSTEITPWPAAAPSIGSMFAMTPE